jgi:AcrR family transcriptional regulator
VTGGAVNSADPALRREGDREIPVGPKAQRTRQQILAAAAAEFAANGYQKTTVAAVAAAAGVSLGTVYQYFRDRSDLVAALVTGSVSTMLDRTDTRWRAAEGDAGLHRIILNFITSYTEVAALAGVWEEVAHIDDDLAQMRRELGRVFTGTVARELRRSAAAGTVRDDVDPELAARALTGMVDRYCYVTYVFDPPRRLPSVDESATVLARLWSAAVGLR